VIEGDDDWIAAHYKKHVQLAIGGVTLRLRVAHDLFSSHAVDAGTAMLLRSLQRRQVRAKRALDLGCGYGPIGLALRALGRAEHVDLCDRDALATLFARRNAADNDIDDADVVESLGYDDLTGRHYDLIVSNIPGKAGERVIAHLLTDARQLLLPRGMVAVVVVAPLAPYVARLIEADARIRVVFRQDGRAYSVFHYTFIGVPAAGEAPAGFGRGLYDSGEVRLEIERHALSLLTVLGLDEEPGPGVTTAHVLAALPSLPASERCFVLNPGQGYVAAALALRAPSQLTLIDRDLLALRASARNVRRAGFTGEVELEHRVGVGVPVETFDAGVMLLREGEGPTAVLRTFEAAAAAVRPGGSLLVAGTSTALTRLERPAAAAGLRPRAHRRRRGVGAVVFERSPGSPNTRRT
jgi:16S rRNA (guanine1207-N2)-methyltransferase